MRFFDYIRTAFKNLARRKSRTILTIVAITVGSLSLILMASIIISIKQTLVEQFDNLGAFDLVTVTKDPNSTDKNSLLGSNGDPSEGKMIDDSTLAAARLIPHVAKITPTISGFSISTVRLEGGTKKTWANIVGYDPDNDVFDLSIAHGRKLKSTDMDKIVVGSRFLEDAGFDGKPEGLLGKKVLLSSKMGGGSAPDWGPLPEKPPANADKDWYESKNRSGIDISAEIVGVTEGGVLDSGQSYITLNWARRLLTNVSWQYPQCQKDQPCSNTMSIVKDDNFVRQGYSSIILKANDQENIGSIADAVSKMGYGANTAQAMLDEINRILLMISIVLAIVGGISLFVATIGIINTMVMATYERTREIGVLRACGATRATIRRLFMAEAASMGLWGGVFGLLIAQVLVRIAKYIVTTKGASLGDLPLDNIGNFPWWLVASVLLFTTLLGALSGLIPAIRAAHMDPVEALRYE